MDASTFGPGSGPVHLMLDEIGDCYPPYHIDNCGHAALGYTRCGHDTDLGLLCQATLGEGGCARRVLGISSASLPCSYGGRMRRAQQSQCSCFSHITSAHAKPDGLMRTAIQMQSNGPLLAQSPRGSRVVCLGAQAVWS